MKRETVLEVVNQERVFQEAKIIKKGWTTDKRLGEFLIILQQQLNEACLAYVKNPTGRNSIEHEIVQIAAVAVAALETLPEESAIFLKEYSNPETYLV